MLDHIGFSASDVEKSRRFYEITLAPLGIKVLMDLSPEITGEKNHYYGFGRDRPHFWVGQSAVASRGIHLAFSADTRAAVDAFYQAALAAGGTDNGAPGVRPHYHEHYYGAFVRDPDGHNIEAVCHKPA
jgi:catechol 2,3-dioxygenase-like lactoylglutathione lyase family enzyme